MDVEEERKNKLGAPGYTSDSNSSLGDAICRFRGKLYILSEDSAWQEAGIGHASLGPELEDLYEAARSVIGTGTNRRLQFKDEESVEPRVGRSFTTDLSLPRMSTSSKGKALSFQDDEGSQAIYSQICHEPGRVLPAPKLTNLQDLARRIALVNPSQREQVAGELAEPEFLAELRETFHSAEEAQVELAQAEFGQIEEPKASKWLFRGVSGSLVLAAVATVCVLKFQSPVATGDATVLASQKMYSVHSGHPFVSCSAGTIHQCPASWNAPGNAGGYHCLHKLKFQKSEAAYQASGGACRPAKQGPFPLDDCAHQCAIGNAGHSGSHGHWGSHWHSSGHSSGGHFSGGHYWGHHSWGHSGDYTGGYYSGGDYTGGDYSGDHGHGSHVSHVIHVHHYGTHHGSSVSHFHDAHWGDAIHSGSPDGYWGAGGHFHSWSDVDGSDYLNGKGPAPVDFGDVDGSDYLNGKGRTS
ncbi:unnamed protein product [Cladocopium goreaui]|uniref:Serine/threonine-protein phosphatase 4 regulatory subunit 3-like central domain-containing protein n=1 Tax=Cladocopium goreaui TaxID=2562237 RepID=A0A9P1CGI8_9DINO|nr:unnamed protein product [Cladocopium goreaui]